MTTETPQAHVLISPAKTTRELIDIVERLNPPKNMRAKVMAFLLAVHDNKPDFQLSATTLRERLGWSLQVYQGVARFLTQKKYYTTVSVRNAGKLHGWAIVVDPLLNVHKLPAVQQPVLHYNCTEDRRGGTLPGKSDRRRLMRQSVMSGKSEDHLVRMAKRRQAESLENKDTDFQTAESEPDCENEQAENASSEGPLYYNVQPIEFENQKTPCSPPGGQGDGSFSQAGCDELGGLGECDWKVELDVPEFPETSNRYTQRFQSPHDVTAAVACVATNHVLPELPAIYEDITGTTPTLGRQITANDFLGRVDAESSLTNALIECTRVSHGLAPSGMSKVLQGSEHLLKPNVQPEDVMGLGRLVRDARTTKAEDKQNVLGMSLPGQMVQDILGRGAELDAALSGSIMRKLARGTMDYTQLVRTWVHDTAYDITRPMAALLSECRLSTRAADQLTDDQRLDAANRATRQEAALDRLIRANTVTLSMCANGCRLDPHLLKHDIISVACDLGRVRKVENVMRDSLCPEYHKPDLYSGTFGRKPRWYWAMLAALSGCETFERVLGFAGLNAEERREALVSEMGRTCAAAILRINPEMCRAFGYETPVHLLTAQLMFVWKLSEALAVMRPHVERSYSWGPTTKFGLKTQAFDEIFRIIYDDIWRPGRA